MEMMITRGVWNLIYSTIRKWGKERLSHSSEAAIGSEPILGMHANKLITQVCLGAVAHY